MERKNSGSSRRGSWFAEHEKAEHGRESLIRLLKFFGHEKMLLTVILAVVLMGTACALIIPALQSHAVDIIAGEREGSLLRILALFAGLSVFYSVLQTMQGWFCAKLGQRLIKRLRRDLFSQTITLPIAFIDRHSHGDLMSHFTNDTDTLQQMLSQSVPQMFSSAMTIISVFICGILMITGTAAVMLWFCWQLALLSFVSVLLTVLSTSLLSKPVRRNSRSRQKELVHKPEDRTLTTAGSADDGHEFPVLYIKGKVVNDGEIFHIILKAYIVKFQHPTASFPMPYPRMPPRSGSML